MPGPSPETDPNAQRPLGMHDRPGIARVTGTEIVAIALAVLWLGVSLFFFLSAPDDAGMGALSIVVTVVLPLAMIWVATIVIRSGQIMREESQRLQATIDLLRQAYFQQTQRGQKPQDSSVVRKLDEIAALARRTDAALASALAQTAEPTPPDAPAEPAPTSDQGALALAAPAEAVAPPLASDDFIRALNFPENAEDKAGFDAMRRALRDRKAAQLIQASQDVLTLLSQEGIYMDDLRPDMARPEIWRQFAQGARGREVAALGGVRERSALALTAGRMKQDPIFRDAAHHFLRLFDRMFAAFEPDASDAELSALGDTRTARAFMLLGRVAGTFD